MTIKIEITGDDVQTIATQILVLGSLINQKVGARTEEVKAEPEILEPKKAPPKKAAVKKAETIEHESTDDEPEQPEQDEPTVEELAAANEEVEDVEAEKPMTIDELRAYTISNYLAEVFPKREDQKDAFKALLDKFEIEKLGDLPEDQATAFKAEVDARIAAAAKK